MLPESIDASTSWPTTQELPSGPLNWLALFQKGLRQQPFLSYFRHIIKLIKNIQFFKQNELMQVAQINSTFSRYSNCITHSHFPRPVFPGNMLRVTIQADVSAGQNLRKKLQESSIIHWISFSGRNSSWVSWFSRSLALCVSTAY